jgi:hypothetical protein
MGISATIGEVVAETIGVGEVLAGTATAAEAIASGTSVAELVAGGALEDLGGGTLLDAATGNVLNAAGETILSPIGEGVGSDAITNTVADQMGNITQTFSDGSSLTTDAAGNILDSTAPTDFGPISDPNATNPILDQLGNKITQKIGSTVANKALNALLAPATKALGTAKFKPVSSVPGAPGSDTGGSGGGSQSGFSDLKPDFTEANTNFSLEGGYTAPTTGNLPNIPTNPALLAPQAQTPQGFAMGGYAQGGLSQMHNPSFFSEGGMKNRYVEGDGDGTSDDVAAMLANGEFVIPADIVAALGNGSNDAGAHVLDQFLSVVRQDNHSNDPDELPPKSKGPLAYLAQARKRA